ncbi:MAG: hypothetical protein ABH950_07395 [Candidatus Altiarchaeota archaeon]
MRLGLVGAIVLTLLLSGCLGEEKVQETLEKPITTSVDIPTTTSTILETTSVLSSSTTTSSIEILTTTSIPTTSTIDPYLITMQELAREAGLVDLIVLINSDEMDRLYGQGFSERFEETISSGSEIVQALGGYRNDKQKYPKQLNELVPEYLDNVPKTRIQHRELQFSPYWNNDDDTLAYFQEYQKFWYYISGDLNSYELKFSGPNEYCYLTTESLEKPNKAETYPFLCETQSVLFRIGPIELTEKVETKSYVFFAPKWRDSTDLYKSMDVHFESYLVGSGKGVFPFRYNNMPVIPTLWLMKDEQESLESLKTDWVSGYTENPDRVFPRDFKIEPKKIELKSGEDAYFIHLRFFRTSKDLNQSRFDLITFDKDTNEGYEMTISIQYEGEFEKAEKDLKLKEFAEQVFESFEFT